MPAGGFFPPLVSRHKKPAEGALGCPSLGYNRQVMGNLPNALTLFRIALVPLLVVVLLTRFSGSEFWGLGIFLLAALTDLFDGFLARRLGSITRTGIFLDPVADKLLMSAAFVSLVELGLAPAWMVVVILGREFAISGLRHVAQEQGVIIPANLWGKLKTLSQIVAVSLCIMSHQLGRWAHLSRLALWVALLMTVASLVSYLKSYWPRLSGQNP